MTDKTFETNPGSDSDAQLAALFAPLPVRTSLLALLAWHDEITGLPLRIREPAIGAMRMEWHREAVCDVFANPPVVRRNPLIEGVATLRGVAGGIDAPLLNSIINTFDHDFEGLRCANIQELETYAAAGWGEVMAISARIIEPQQDWTKPLASAGRAWGLTQIIQTFALRARRSIPLIPDDILELSGLNDARLASGQEAEKARAALMPVIEAAHDALVIARQDVRDLPPELFPAWGPVALVPGYLKQARKVADPYRNAVTLSPLTKRLTLMKASLTGRI